MEGPFKYFLWIFDSTNSIQRIKLDICRIFAENADIYALDFVTDAQTGASLLRIENFCRKRKKSQPLPVFSQP